MGLSLCRFSSLPVAIRVVVYGLSIFGVYPSACDKSSGVLWIIEPSNGWLVVCQFLLFVYDGEFCLLCCREFLSSAFVWVLFSIWPQ